MPERHVTTSRVSDQSPSAISHSRSSMGLIFQHGSGYWFGILIGPLTSTIRPMLASHLGKSPTITARSPSLQRKFIACSSTPVVWHRTCRGTHAQRFSSIYESPRNLSLNRRRLFETKKPSSEGCIRLVAHRATSALQYHLARIGRLVWAYAQLLMIGVTLPVRGRIGNANQH